MRMKFTDIVEFSGKTCSTFDGKKNYISTGCVHDNHICKDEIETVEYINKPSRANLVVEPGDILFAKMQATKKTLLINEDLSQNIYSTGFYAVKPKDGLITKKCLFYLINSSLFLGEKDKNCSGATQKAINNQGLSSIELNIPEFSVQKLLTQKLDVLSKAIEVKQSQIRFFDNLIKARFVEMFGVPGANSKGWNEIKLGEVCSLQNGYAFKSSDYINKSGVLNCRMSNIRPDGGFDAEYHPKYLPEEYWYKCSGYRLFDGDVIIAMTDMASDPKILGVPTIVSTNGKKFLLNQRVGKLSFLHDDRMNRIYLMHSLGQKYIRKELAKSAAGSTQINVGKPAILNINIYDPPRSLQDQFATFVAQVDKSKFVLSNELTMCDFYIRLIHDRVMHGRINLRVAQ